MVAGVGLGLGALFLLATTSAAKKRKAASTRKPALPTQPQGRPLCPSEASTSPADLTGLKSGDFVVVTLANKPGTLRDSTWAEVLNVGSRITVELVGSQRQKIGEQSEVVPESLKADWHGFHTGQKMFLRPECIWDVLHTHTKPGTLLCGSKGMFFLGKPPLTHRFLAPGFDVLLLLGSPGGSAVETVWATVTRISTTGSVITAQISGAPKHSTIHGFVVGDHLEFARDCIFGVRPV